LCVNHLNIQPTEAWKVDIVEVVHLMDNPESNEMDLSVMLNFERVKNGASKQWLQKN